MDLVDVAKLLQQYGGGLAVFALMVGAIYYVVHNLQRDGADLGIRSLKTALEQNATDLVNVRSELTAVRAELTKVKDTVAAQTKEMGVTRRELIALRRYAQTLRDIIKRDLPNAELPAEPGKANLS